MSPARGLEHSNHHPKEHGTGHGHYVVSHEDLVPAPAPPPSPTYHNPAPPTSPPPPPGP